jgi:hypothetical protein
MPCQCGATAAAEGHADPTYGGCECGTEGAGVCECGGGAPTPSDHERSIERVVMELDMRVRKLEASLMEAGHSG